MKKQLLAVLVSLVMGAGALALNASAVAATPEDDVARYLVVFNGPAAAHSDAADTFSWIGLSDTRLFDIIEQRLLQDAQAARNDRDERNRVARYIRALGFSGQAKYIPTIRKLQEDKLYQRFAVAALEDQVDYQKWNPVISDRASFNPAWSDDVNRVANMLRSNDMMLKRVGAKRVYFAHQREPALLEMLATNVQADLAMTDSRYVDAVSWEVKALGNAKQEQYVPLLQKVRAEAKESKVRDYAKKALEAK